MSVFSENYSFYGHSIVSFIGKLKDYPFSDRSYYINNIVEYLCGRYEAPHNEVYIDVMDAYFNDIECYQRVPADYRKFYVSPRWS